MKNRIEQDIIERKVFKPLLPILKKINFEVAYTYQNDNYSDEILAIINVPVGLYERIQDLYVRYQKHSQLYVLLTDDFVIFATENIKNIESILEGLLNLATLEEE